MDLIRKIDILILKRMDIILSNAIRKIYELLEKNKKTEEELRFYKEIFDPDSENIGDDEEKHVINKIGIFPKGDKYFDDFEGEIISKIHMAIWTCPECNQCNIWNPFSVHRLVDCYCCDLENVEISEQARIDWFKEIAKKKMYDNILDEN